MIRSAAEKDLPALAALKTAYLTGRYHGLARADVLRTASPDRFLPEFAGWLADPDFRVDVLTDEAGIESYIVYATEDGAAGVILEARNRCRCDGEEDARLLSHAVLRLRQAGCATVRTWLYRNNYRKRFLFENCGFRSTGEIRQAEHNGQSFEMVRYELAL